MLDFGMGKYMKKSNKASEISVMEDPQQISSLFVGVLTRAKTLALKKLGVLPAPEDGGSYIQLRSRRLRTNVLVHKQKKRRGPTRARARARPEAEGDAVEVENVPGADGSGQLDVEIEEEVKDESIGVGSQGSVGGNALAGQENGREQREATPASLPRDPDVIRTPGSSTRPRNSIEDNGSVLDPVPRFYPPTDDELDAFFSEAEKLQQKQFMEKYNFDPVNDKPLPGRYEWVKVDP